MNIKLLFFGIATDLVGESTINFNLDENTTVNKLKELLKKNYLKLENLNDYAIAVNEEYAEKDLILKNNDIVAIIPPVSGG